MTEKLQKHLKRDDFEEYMKRQKEAQRHYHRKYEDTDDEFMKYMQHQSELLRQRPRKIVHPQIPDEDNLQDGGFALVILLIMSIIFFGYVTRLRLFFIPLFKFLC